MDYLLASVFDNEVKTTIQLGNMLAFQLYNEVCVVVIKWKPKYK